MGVAGLLPFLDRGMTKRNISSFKGSIVAVDASIWICRAASVIPSASFVIAYILRRIKLIEEAGCTPILVFDGVAPTSKDAEIARRASALQKLIEKKKIKSDSKDNEDDTEDDIAALTDIIEDHGEEEDFILSVKASFQPLPLKDKSEIDEEEREFIRSTQVQTQKDEKEQAEAIETGDEVLDKEVPLVSSNARRTFATKIMEVLEKIGVPFIGSPAESDAQIAWLVKKEIVDLVITDDSDLIIYGCPKILFKMTIEGWGDLYEKKNVPGILGFEAEGFNIQFLRWICIVSGTDYFKTPGVGFQTARKLAAEGYTDDYEEFKERILQAIPKVAQLQWKTYEENFDRTEDTFQFQLIFNIISGLVEPLNPYDDDKSYQNYLFAGKMLNEQMGLAVAAGRVDLKNMQIYRPAPIDPTIPKLHFLKLELLSKGCPFKLPDPDEEELLQCLNNKKKTYDCLQCEKSYLGMFKFTIHMRLHNGKRPYKCKDCEKEFRSKQLLDSHSSIHSTIPKYSCPICNKGFTESHHLKNHHAEHHITKRPHLCCFCEKAFSTKQYLTGHIQVHTKKKDVECSQCEFTCRFPHHLRRHIREKHLKEKKYSCPECNTFKHFRFCQIAQHIRLVHRQERNFPCICRKSFLFKQNLSDHEKICKVKRTTMSEAEIAKADAAISRQCPYCPKKVYTKKSALTAHLKICPGTNDPTLQKVSYNCTFPKCNKQFSYKNGLARHMITHAPRSEWKHECKGCSVKFDRPEKLKNHQKTCQKYKKKFGKQTSTLPSTPVKSQKRKAEDNDDVPQNLLTAIHEKKEAQKVFVHKQMTLEVFGHKQMTLEVLGHKQMTTVHSNKCPYCSQTFSFIHNLTEHLTICKERRKTMTKEEAAALDAANSIQCLHCSTVLSRKRSLSEHLKICPARKDHLKVTFKCTVESCKKVFSQKKGLTRHMLTHASQSEWKHQCKGCNVKFSRPDRLADHQNTCPKYKKKIGKQTSTLPTTLIKT